MPYYIDDIKAMNKAYTAPVVPDTSSEPESSSEPDSSEPDSDITTIETKPFTPDDLTSNADKRITLNDNEFGWYADEQLYNGTQLLDGSRIFDYDPPLRVTGRRWRIILFARIPMTATERHSCLKLITPLTSRNFDIVIQRFTNTREGR